MSSSVRAIPWLPAAAAFLGCAALVIYGDAVSAGSVFGPWWPAAGLGAGLAIGQRGRGSRVAVALATGAGHWWGALAPGDDRVEPALLGILASIQVLVVTVAWDRAVPSGMLLRQGDVVRYLLSLLVAVAPTALLVVSEMPAGRTMSADLALAGSYYVANVVGLMAVATPIVLWRPRDGLVPAAGRLEHALLLLGVCAVTFAVFWPAGNHALAFVALLPLLPAGARCGPFWASICGLAGSVTVAGCVAVNPAEAVATLLPAFVVVSAAKSLVLGTAVQERRRNEADLVAARDAAQETAREYEAFSYAVAHDLRTPLRAIDGFGHALLVDHTDQLSPDGRELLERVRSSARYMALLIDSLLTFAKVGRADVEPSTVDLSRMTMDSVERLRAGEPGRVVEIKVAPGARLQVDGPLFAVVLDNLIGNAWNFTRDAEHPVIEFGWRTTGAGTEFWVTDNGMGFDMAFADKLFKPFQRLHSRAVAKGTGIGLATTARIVQRHGGTISAQGTVGEGATFTVAVPVRIPAQRRDDR